MQTKTSNYIIARIYSLCILLFRKLMIFFLIIMPSVSFAQSFEEAENLFRSNQPQLAIPLFQRSILDGSAEPTVYNFLGISFMQIGDTQKALDTFTEGMAVAGTNKRSLYYNAGNAAYLLQNYEQAKEYFSFSLVADSGYANAYLNRGNTNVQLTAYQEAIDDYNNYLLLDPASAQADGVRRMIAALQQEIIFQQQEAERIAAEQKRLEEEQKRIEEEQQRIAAEKAAAEAARIAEEERIAAEQAAAEAARIAEEQRRLEEEERRIAAEKAAAEEEARRIAAEQAAAEEARRQQILAEVSASLQAGGATNLSAGSEGGLDYEFEEAELE